MVLMCAGMSSGPSVSWVQPAFSGASRDSAVVRSTSTDGSAFSWIVSEAEVCRMNSVSAPSRALNLIDELRGFAGEIGEAAARRLHGQQRRCDGGGLHRRWRRARDAIWLMSSKISQLECRRRLGKARAITHKCEREDERWRRAARKTERPRRARPRPSPGRHRSRPSNLPRHVLLHAVGHVDQPAPGLFQERHHADRHPGRSAAGSRSCGRPRRPSARLLERIGFRQRLVDLARHGRPRRDLPLQLLDFGLEPADLGVERGAFVGHRVTGPAGAVLACRSIPCRCGCRAAARLRGWASCV